MQFILQYSNGFDVLSKLKGLDSVEILSTWGTHALHHPQAQATDIKDLIQLHKDDLIDLVINAADKTQNKIFTDHFIQLLPESLKCMKDEARFYIDIKSMKLVRNRDHQLKEFRDGKMTRNNAQPHFTPTTFTNELKVSHDHTIAQTVTGLTLKLNDINRLQLESQSQITHINLSNFNQNGRTLYDFVSVNNEIYDDSVSFNYLLHCLKELKISTEDTSIILDTISDIQHRNDLGNEILIEQASKFHRIKRI